MNNDIKEKIKATGLHQYEVAKLCGVHETTFVRWLRYELDQEKKDKILKAIDLLKEQEPAEIEREGGGSTWWYVCGECHGAVDLSDQYCKHCGRKLRGDQ